MVKQPRALTIPRRVPFDKSKTGFDQSKTGFDQSKTGYLNQISNLEMDYNVNNLLQVVDYSDSIIN